MLEMRPDCEACGRDLPADSRYARIRSFECTFCGACVDGRLRSVCPNCGGAFGERPIRMGAALERSPASTVRRHRG